MIATNFYRTKILHSITHVIDNVLHGREWDCWPAIVGVKFLAHFLHINLVGGSLHLN